MATKPRKPKAPKQKASLETWKKYTERVKIWEKKCHQIDADKKAKSALIGRIRGK